MLWTSGPAHFFLFLKWYLHFRYELHNSTIVVGSINSEQADHLATLPNYLVHSSSNKQ